MVFTLLSWLYIGLISFVYGMAVFSIAYLKKPEKRIGRSPDLVVLTGFMLATVYAQFFSLFGRVGTVANVVLAAVGYFGFSLQKDVCTVFPGNKGADVAVSVSVCAGDCRSIYRDHPVV